MKRIGAVQQALELEWKEIHYLERRYEEQLQAIQDRLHQARRRKQEILQAMNEIGGGFYEVVSNM